MPTRGLSIGTFTSLGGAETTTRRVDLAGMEDSRKRQARAETSEVLSALMRAAQDGDAAAYASLLRIVTPQLRRFVQSRRRFLQGSDIEDVVQDILLSVHSVRATYDHTRPFLPWIYAIAHNRLADSGRRQTRRNAREVLVDQIPVTISEDETNTGDEPFGDPEELRRAIESLPAGQREAIEMLKLQEMSLKDASARTGSSVGALKVSVHRAMATLRRLLKDSQDGN